jgi:predicted nucleic acid-binding protein
VIILDTNVLSEPLRSRPDPSVLSWFTQTSKELWITSVSLGEILTGVMLLPHGRRRDGLASAVEATVASFGDRILPYDAASAREFADVKAGRRAIGEPISTEDAQIAAICLDRGATLATRNTKDFQNLGLTLIDPWAM